MAHRSPGTRTVIAPWLIMPGSRVRVPPFPPCMNRLGERFLVSLNRITLNGSLPVSGVPARGPDWCTQSGPAWGEPEAAVPGVSL
jgi:hypothetical protein